MSFQVIALDGPAGSGKSTIAKILSQRIGYHYLDSGALYRGLTFILFQEFQSESKGNTHFSQFMFQYCANLPLHFWDIPLYLKFGQEGENLIFWGEDKLGEEIRTPELTRLIQYVADKAPCRDKVNREIRRIALEHPLVLDGRDIGTAVFPEAKLKFFLVAKPEIRAQRRAKELAEKGIPFDPKILETEIRERDKTDQERAIAPLRKAPDAIPVDTSDLSTEAVVNAILSRLS